MRVTKDIAVFSLAYIFFYNAKLYCLTYRLFMRDIARSSKGFVWFPSDLSYVFL